ncbi:hypothetical protein SLITO_v1c01220 [Spiroplasma litorale]|uniref:Uncharacterized protein n=1 Tax=Spiroplasma litorale TaxID=216942 RepID=A0A0K1W0G3_9MOLU|nr:hypothetical protein SLITO_v1c01220 [Spiroplasma litorale]
MINKKIIKSIYKSIYKQKEKFLVLVFISGILDIVFFYNYNYEFLFGFWMYFLINSFLIIVSSFIVTLVSLKPLINKNYFLMKLTYTKELYYNFLNALYIVSPFIYIALNLITITRILIKNYFNFIKIKFFYYYINKITYKLKYIFKWVWNIFNSFWKTKENTIYYKQGNNFLKWKIKNNMQYMLFFMFSSIV